MRRNLSLLLALTLLTVLVAWFGSERFIARPVQALLGAIEQLRRGERTARSGIGRFRSGEMDRLALAFDQMADSLEQREVELEQSQEKLRQAQKMEAVEEALATAPDALPATGTPTA